MEAEAKKTARRWADYFSNRGFSSFESDTGIHVDESRYEAAIILPSLVNGVHFSLDMDSLAKQLLCQDAPGSGGAPFTGTGAA